MNGSILANRSLDKRNKSDFYPTPPECTQALIDFLGLPKNMVIWEPACGKGDMAKVFQDEGFKVICTDINQYGFEDETLDFLTCKTKECDWIITNPPFSLSEEFIEKCISIKKPFAMLLKSQYWHSKKRLKLFEKLPPKYVLPLTWRPDFEFGKRGGSPTMECIWTVWIPGFLRITQYIPLEKPQKGKNTCDLCKIR